MAYRYYDNPDILHNTSAVSAPSVNLSSSKVQKAQKLLVETSIPDLLDLYKQKNNGNYADLPSGQMLAVQRNLWAKKRTIMANKRTMLAYVRTLFLISIVAKDHSKPEWAWFGIVFAIIVALEFFYNVGGITFGIKAFVKYNKCFDGVFDLYPIGVLIILTIILGFST